MAQIGKQIESVEIRDAKLYKMTADTASAPTYDAGIDIPNAVQLTWTPEIATAEIQGDYRKEGGFSKVLAYDVQIQANSMPLDAIAVILGGTVTQTAETTIGAGDSKTVYKPTSADLPNYFKIMGVAGQAQESGGAKAAARVVGFYKCKVTGVSDMGLGDGVARISVSAKAYWTRSDDAIMEDGLYEDASEVLA